MSIAPSCSWRSAPFLCSPPSSPPAAATASPATRRQGRRPDRSRRTTFNHWLQIAAVSAAGQQQPGGRQPRPRSRSRTRRDFTKLRRAAKKATAAKPAKGQPEPTDAQLKKQCKQEYERCATRSCSS